MKLVSLTVLFAVVVPSLFTGIGSAAPPTCHPVTGKPATCAKPKPLPPPAKLAARIQLGAPVLALTDGFGSVWARVGGDATNGCATIDRIDPSTNTVVASLTVPKGFGLTAGGGALWAADYVDNALLRIDPATNSVTSTVALPDVGPVAVAATLGSVWVGTQGPEGQPGKVIRVDTTTNAVISAVSLRNGAVYETANSSGVWIVDGTQLASVASSGVIRQTNVTTSTQTPCGGIAADSSSVWLAGGVCGFPRFALAKLSATGSIVARVQIPQAEGVSLGFGSAWAATAHTLIRVNEASAKVVGSMPIGLGGNATVHVAFGAVWAGGQSGVLERFLPR